MIADDSGEGEKEFKREISSLASLDHPCVVKFAGCALLCSLTDHRFLIFTEYVSGGSLSVVIEDPARFAWFNSAGRTSVGLGCYSETRRNNHQCLSIASVRPCLFFARGDLLDPPDITLRPLFPFSPQQPKRTALLKQDFHLVCFVWIHERTRRKPRMSTSKIQKNTFIFQNFECLYDRIFER